MFKQKPKYEQPAADVRWCVLETVIVTSTVSFDSAGVTAEGFTEDEGIDF